MTRNGFFLLINQVSDRSSEETKPRFFGGRGDPRQKKDLGKDEETSRRVPCRLKSPSRPERLGGRAEPVPDGPYRPRHFLRCPTFGTTRRLSLSTARTPGPTYRRGTRRQRGRHITLPTVPGPGRVVGKVPTTRDFYVGSRVHGPAP